MCWLQSSLRHSASVLRAFPGPPEHFSFPPSRFQRFPGTPANWCPTSTPPQAVLLRNFWRGCRGRERSDQRRLVKRLQCTRRLRSRHLIIIVMRRQTPRANDLAAVENNKPGVLTLLSPCSRHRTVMKNVSVLSSIDFHQRSSNRQRFTAILGVGLVYLSQKRNENVSHFSHPLSSSRCRRRKQSLLPRNPRRLVQNTKSAQGHRLNPLSSYSGLTRVSMRLLNLSNKQANMCTFNSPTHHGPSDQVRG